jgi:hypothetical protein
MPAHSWANSLPVLPTPGLNLIKDQQDAMFIAQLPQTAHAFIWQRADTALALYRLDQDGGCFIW